MFSFMLCLLWAISTWTRNLQEKTHAAQAVAVALGCHYTFDEGHISYGIVTGPMPLNKHL